MRALGAKVKALTGINHWTRYISVWLTGGRDPSMQEGPGGLAFWKVSLSALVCGDVAAILGAKRTRLRRLS